MTTPIRIPADISLPDKIIGPLTARQTVIAGVGALALYGIWLLAQSVVSPLVFLAGSAPVVVAVAVIVAGIRDGITMDKYLAAAIRHTLAPKRQVPAPAGIAAPPAWATTQVSPTPNNAAGQTGTRANHHPRTVVPAPLRMPVRAVTSTAPDGAHPDGIGIADLGPGGFALIAAASAVNLGLRSPDEQDTLLAVFGGMLHSLSSPVQILIRTQQPDLSSHIAIHRRATTTLNHPGLRASAGEHADFLQSLSAAGDLTMQQVLLVFREHRADTAESGGAVQAMLRRLTRRKPGPALPGVVLDGAGKTTIYRLVRAMSESAHLLAPAGIRLVALTVGQTTAILASAANPGSLLPPNPAIAPAGGTITAAHNPVRRTQPPASVFQHPLPTQRPRS